VTRRRDERWGRLVRAAERARDRAARAYALHQRAWKWDKRRAKAAYRRWERFLTKAARLDAAARDWLEEAPL